MTFETRILERVHWLKYWPCVLAGLLFPLLAKFLTIWLHPYLAEGIAGFTVGATMMLLLSRYFPLKRRVPVWLAAIICGAATGAAAMSMSYVLKWP